MSESRKTITEQIPAPAHLRRLGKNINGYFGETIDITAVLADCARAARACGWYIETIPVNRDFGLLAFARPAHPGTLVSPSGDANAKRIYLSAGIHGDEPAGPLAALQLLQENRWPGDLHLTLFPCLNPAGFLLNRRENPDGHDLNRQYLEPVAPETQAHVAWLQGQTPFELCLCLHEDWESHGFYVYELNPDNRPSLAEAIVAGVAEVCPIDRSEIIEGRPAKEGIIRPSIDPATRPQWPESFFLLTHKTRLSYTLEAPSDFALSARVAALVVGVNTALKTFRASTEQSISAGTSERS